MSSIKRIPPRSLQVGMYITGMESASGEQGSNLHTEGLLTREDTVAQLMKMNVQAVFIDVDKGIDCTGSISIDDIQVSADGHALPKPSCIEISVPKALDTDQIGRAKVPFSEELEKAKALQNKALALVGDVMRDVKMGRAVNMTSVDEVTTEITESLANNQNALASLMRQRSMDTYLFEHSLNVSVLMGIMARSLGYQEHNVKELVLGAFLHDIGKIRVPDEILHKPGKLEEHEWLEMKRHVDYGIEALNDVDGISQIAKDICALHHEKLDGTGYPFGIDQSRLPRHTRMASVVDVYDAVTADRCYHQGMEPTEALKKMLTWTGDHLDKDLVYQLIRCVGVYPPGSFVELESGHIAMVREQRATHPNMPVVNMVYDIKRKRTLDGFIVDLRKHRNYGSVARAANPDTYGLKVTDFLVG